MYKDLLGSEPLLAAARVPRHDQAPARATNQLAVDRFRRLTFVLLFVSTLIAAVLIIGLGVRLDPQGTYVLDWLVAGLLLSSRIWWNRTEHQRVADACGTMAAVALSGMSCGSIAMLELRLHFPLADTMLQSFDHALGIDGLAIVATLARQGHWIFWLMAPAYNGTVPIFFAGLFALTIFGDRVEAWRATFCFIGTLFTTCLVAIFVPAKGLAVWASRELLAQLPDQAMRSFWTHFDEFYFGANPILRPHVIDGVISFPSFHAVMGFLILAMWRKNIVTLLLAGIWFVLMLLGTLPGGGHYIVDLIAGFVVWVGWFAISLRLERETVRKYRQADSHIVVPGS